MKRLWKYIPPCLSDVMGFQAIMTQTDGLGIIDDPGTYKPLSTMGVGDARPMSLEDRAGLGGGRGPKMRDGEGRGHGVEFEGGHRGGPGRGGRDIPQIADSAIRNEDVITGTEKKIYQAFEGKKANNPSFVLICNAPSSAMISSDIDSAAIKISNDGTDAGCVRIYGDKDYVYGMSMTNEAIAKLLLKEGTKQNNAVNILGCSCIDWNKNTASSIEALLNEEGIEVICKWGDVQMTRDNICKSTNAALNIVAGVSGLKAAKYMESEFGIPYITGAPFGEKQTKELIRRVKEYLAGDESNSNKIGIGEGSDQAEVIVIGEQFTCNAIRNVLRSEGYSSVKVLSFFEMDKAHMEAGDKKIVSEDELLAITSEPQVKMIIANPDYKGAAKKDVKWIDMPNSGMSMITKIDAFDMTGANLDNWLKASL